MDPSYYEPARRRSCAACPSEVVKCCGVCAMDPCGEHSGRPLALVHRMAQLGWNVSKFTPCRFFRTIVGRTVWFIGDSQTRNFYNAAECFLHSFAHHPALRRTLPLEDPQLARLLHVADVQEQRVHPYCLALLLDTRVCVLRLDHGSSLVDQLLPTLVEHVPRFRNDVVVTNFGLHYPHPANIGAFARGAQNLTQHAEAFAAFVTNASARLPPIFWLETPPQHFPNPLGVFLGKGTFQCDPLNGSTVEVASGGYYNRATLPAIRAAGITVIDTWHDAVDLWEYHSGLHAGQDCTHFCNPGVYQWWLMKLHAVLEELWMGLE